MAYLLVPRRVPGLPALALRSLRDLVRMGSLSVPFALEAMSRPDGFCGLTGPIGVPELLAGYSRGLFVMSHIGPLKWWAPEHRMVLFFDKARIDKTTRRLLRAGRFRITLDTAFADVIDACAAPRPGQAPLTWITPRLRQLFMDAHAAGHAHSVEVWKEDGLVGGVFGLAAGKVFFTESQFHTARDASKVAFAALNRHLQAWGFAFNDGKHATQYLADLGFQPLTREEFTAATTEFATAPGRVGRWRVDEALLAGEWEPGAVAGIRMQDVLPRGSLCRWTAADLLGKRRSNTW
jgi:leucyl/phenylalanyl-tRNA--protein transferase